MPGRQLGKAPASRLDRLTKGALPGLLRSEAFGKLKPGERDGPCLALRVLQADAVPDRSAAEKAEVRPRPARPGPRLAKAMGQGAR